MILETEKYIVTNVKIYKNTYEQFEITNSCFLSKELYFL